MAHGKTFCKYCNTLLLQCRCMESHTQVNWAVCAVCSKKEITPDTPRYDKDIAKCECKPQYDEAHNMYMKFCTLHQLAQELVDSLKLLLDSIPHHEGDDNLTEPIEKARAILARVKVI